MEPTFLAMFSLAMFSRALLVSLMTAFSLMTPAHATELALIQIIVANETPEALECQALAGHWFSFDLGSKAPHEKLPINMSYDPATGTVMMHNSRNEPLPLESVYCGYRGRAWETRFVFPLRTLAARAAQSGPVTLVCRSEDTAPSCS
jgi:hypothetical protein